MIMTPVTESWGQPPISQYAIDTDGESMYATALYDPYGELGCLNAPRADMAILTSEDVEDVAILMETRDEPRIPWEQVKEELARDGLL
jgi:hypothetical protein